MATIVASVDET